MDITYLGAGSVKLSGKGINLVCDPVGSTKADVVTVSGPAEKGEWPVPAGAMLIDGPGEYEVKGAIITGVPARLHIDEEGQRGTVYSLVVDGVNVVVTGNVAGKLDAEEVEQLGSVDVLVVPVGGGGLTLDAEGASDVVAQLEPGYVVPVHYDDGVSKYPVPQAGVELFLKEMGVSPEPEPKLRVNAKEAPAETQVVVLKTAS
ncbi:MAG TPA: MBL fold metallo-hydrolase [Candidatus Saccharimonadia bacterium]|jgi:L-ascorbate metabolism protein UlaG (beta-lactamase superfamily)|nr:MBL fold metallo-hydrolase [Candidatus Saccharimonadia bacterium]